jgi:uncharacterized protein
MRREKIKAIIDTNLFISYLIGKRLNGLKRLLIESKIELVFAEQNLREILMVTSREKFQKYFLRSDVDELIEFIRIIGNIYEISEIKNICRDPKDDFLLSLSSESKADYLVTGDKDLLELKKHQNTEIITIEKFEKKIQEL